jgi:hypothetical protein
MERAFGQAFDDVRIHDGAEAAEVGALAYSRGDDIHFQPGRYDPWTGNGQELLGHELTPVVPQRPGGPTAPQPDAPEAAPTHDDAVLEAEAE